eukprot:SAG31_NODE_42896_length_269_cov_0.923529_1_plen_56_part_10
MPGEPPQPILLALLAGDEEGGRRVSRLVHTIAAVRSEIRLRGDSACTARALRKQLL